MGFLRISMFLAAFISDAAESETIATAATKQNNYPDPTAAKSIVTSFVSKAYTAEPVSTETAK
ncbi:MAG: hypothetical protein ACM3S4_12535 [Burkholderiales bacterium]